MEFNEVVKNRYSCKKFDGRKVEKLEKAVRLMADLLEGRESGEKEGYISIEDLRELLR